MSSSDSPRSVWSLSDLAAALGVAPQRMLSDWQAQGVGIDSRTLQPGEVFVCVRGDRTDGHRYIPNALAAGAAALIIEEQAALVDDLQLPSPSDPEMASVAIFLVPDGLVALQDLARFHRDRMHGTVLGVTGSNGKTSAKEMLAGLLRELFPEDSDGVGGTARAVPRVAATQGNLNNHFGVPLTLLAMPAETEFAVIEMGMNHAGEIELLSQIARPDHALITSIAPVHVENFPGTIEEGGDIAGIARAKLEIVAGMPAGGVLVYPSGAFGLGLAVEAARHRQLSLLVVEPEPAPAQLGPAEVSGVAGTGLSFIWRGQTLHTPAYHNPVMIHNLVACLELLSAAKLAPGRDAALAGAAPRIRPQTGRRFEIIERPRPGRSPQLLVDDSYNANPASFGRALEALRRLLPEGRLACFAGEMGELGPEHGPAGHREVGAVAALQGYEFVAVCGGESAEALKDSFARDEGPVTPAERETRSAGSVDALLSELDLQTLAAYDGVLVKGSRSARMDRLCDALREVDYR